MRRLLACGLWLASLSACGASLYPPGGDGLPPGTSVIGGNGSGATGVGGAGGMGSGGSAPTSDGGTQLALLRLTNLSGDAGPLDICVRTTGTSGWPDGLALAPTTPGGVTYPGVSGFVSVPAGAPIDIRLAVAGTNCTTGNKLVDLTSIGPFADGKFYSVAAVGLKARNGSDGLSLAVFKDDVAPDPANIKLRFIDAAPALGGAVDLVSETVKDGAPTRLFTSVAFGKIADTTLSANAQLSAKGYATLPSAPTALGVRLDSGGMPGTSDALYIGAPGLQPGAVYSVYTIGAEAVHALVCVDTAASATAASCTRI
jgi:hypothetical protein